MLNNISSSTINFISTTQSTKNIQNSKIDSNKEIDKNVKKEDVSKSVEVNISTDKNKTQREKKLKINNMINQAELQTKNFEKLVSSIFSKQSNKAGLVNMIQKGNMQNFFKNLVVDEKTIEKAKKDISEDGYYGVKQTSERILSFAKAVAGDDPKQIQKMRDAVEKGFKKAEDMWGGKLPEISQKTYESVMNKFDEWQGKGETKPNQKPQPK